MYLINGADDEPSLASSLKLNVEYFSSLRNLGLLQISKGGAKSTPNKDTWVNFFTLQNIENIEFESKKKIKLQNEKN